MMLHSWCNDTNVLLADNVGFGKTIQVVQLINILYQRYKVYGPHLVIAPMSTIGAWSAEIKRWFGGKLAVLIGNEENRKLVIKNQIAVYNFNIVLTSPDIAIIERDVLSEIRWSLLCIDEAHAVKNASTLRNKTFRNFQKDHVIMLTATPLANGVSELFNLLKFLNPDKMQIILNQVENSDWSSNDSIIRSML